MTGARRGLVLALLVPAVTLARDARPATGQPAAGGPGRGQAAAPAGPPVPRLAVPASWQPQPALVTAAQAAADAEGGRRPRTVAAWGDPVLGCFATALALELGAGDVPTVLPELQAALAAGATVEGWTEDGGQVTAAFARPGWQGTLRALVTTRTSSRATVVACFYNDRAPTRCQAACGALLASLPDGNLRNP